MEDLSNVYICRSPLRFNMSSFLYLWLVNHIWPAISDKAKQFGQAMQIFLHLEGWKQWISK